MGFENRPFLIRAEKWEDFLNHKTDDETLERCKRIEQMINMDAPVIKNRSEDREHQEVKGENMAEQRLIDANKMAVEESEAFMSAQISGKISHITQDINIVVHWKIQQLIADTPTVDPETLPIVQKLRAELARMTAEKYAAVETIFKYAGCQECKWWDDKDGFCEKQGRNAVLYDWLCSPVWRGAKEE